MLFYVISGKWKMISLKRKQLLFFNSYQEEDSAMITGPFHKGSYERFLFYEFLEPVVNYRSNEFVALTNLCETGLRGLSNIYNRWKNSENS